jgi:hypothetical protein
LQKSFPQAGNRNTNPFTKKSTLFIVHPIWHSCNHADWFAEEKKTFIPNTIKKTNMPGFLFCHSTKNEKKGH